MNGEQSAISDQRSAVQTELRLVEIREFFITAGCTICGCGHYSWHRVADPAFLIEGTEFPMLVVHRPLEATAINMVPPANLQPWVVTESRSGFHVGSGFTKDLAAEDAVLTCESKGLDAFNAAIENRLAIIAKDIHVPCPNNLEPV